MHGQLAREFAEKAMILHQETEFERAAHQLVDLACYAMHGDHAGVLVVHDGVLEMVDATDEIIEKADEITDVIEERLPGGVVVNRVFDFVLVPGRFGVRIARSVLSVDRNE